jgi:hypothetical protein
VPQTFEFERLRLLYAGKLGTAETKANILVCRLKFLNMDASDATQIKYCAFQVSILLHCRAKGKRNFPESANR